MQKKHAVIAAPYEPSGCTWLINCLLELNVNVFTVSEERMWQQNGKTHQLKKNAYKFAKWLPTLAVKQAFSFRDDIDVIWMHDFPAKQIQFDKHIFFVRDPRGAIYSQYKRHNVQISFEEYVHSTQPEFQMNIVYKWCLFALCWLSVPGIKVIRFEDYKFDGQKTLANALSYLELDNYTKDDIVRATTNSTFEKTKTVEETLAKLDNDPRTVVRAGKVREWEEFSDKSDIDAIDYITKITLPLLTILEYEKDNNAAALSSSDFMHYLTPQFLANMHHPFSAEQ